MTDNNKYTRGITEPVVIGRPVYPDGGSKPVGIPAPDPRGYVITEPLRPESKVVYTPNRIENDPNFVNVPKQTAIGYEYELDEDILLHRLKNKNFNIKVLRCNDGFVSTGIGNRYELWEPKKPIFLSARTGTGKNHFIENILICEHVLKMNLQETTDNRVIILSNRIALNSQQKHRIEKTGVAKVLLYQSFLNFITFNKNLDKYKYIVCDESHFFVSDGSFNPNTAIILEGIINNFQHAVRIYMSSTFNDSLEYLLEYEQRIYDVHNWKLPTASNKIRQTEGLTFLYFQFVRDYSYLNLNSYSAFSELYDIIFDSVNNGEKWLIFIDHKEKCKDIKIDLLKHFEEEGAALKEEDIKVISAESKDDEDYKEAIIAEQFEEKIVLSTCVIDNGVNLKDAPLLNIVLSDTSKVKCLQMVGRKRVEEDQKVNLYLKKFTKKYISDRIKDLEEQRAAYGLYNLAYDNPPGTGNTGWDRLSYRRKFNDIYYNGNEYDFRDAKYWFYRDKDEPERVKPNDIAVSFVDILIARYEFIRDRMIETGSGEEFLNQQCGWFSSSYIEKNDVSIHRPPSAREEFNEFIEGLHGRVIPTDEQDSFGKKFFLKHKKAYGLRTKEKGFKGDDNPARMKYGYNLINEVFEVRGINLILETIKDGWMIKDRT